MLGYNFDKFLADSIFNLLHWSGLAFGINVLVNFIPTNHHRSTKKLLTADQQRVKWGNNLWGCFIKVPFIASILFNPSDGKPEFCVCLLSYLSFH